MYSLKVLSVFNLCYYIKMINSNYIEFSKIYKRVMDIELVLKTNLFKALKFTYPTQMFYVLIPFLKRNLIGRYKKTSSKGSRDYIIDLINKKTSEEIKLKEFIHIAYLSDILKILTEYKKIYKDTKFNNCFYFNKKINFNDLKKYSSKLKTLRNTIMHFNITNYQQNKSIYKETLIYWERLINCKNCFIHQLPPIRPTIKNILNQLKIYYPDIYQFNDRYFCDVFDDIALKNNLPAEKLPQYWSIGRQMYQIKREIRNQ